MQHEGRRYLFEEEKGFNIMYYNSDYILVHREMSTDEKKTFLDRVAEDGSCKNHEQYAPLFSNACALLKDE